MEMIHGGSDMTNELVAIYECVEKSHRQRQCRHTPAAVTIISHSILGLYAIAE